MAQGYELLEDNVTHLRDAIAVALTHRYTYKGREVIRLSETGWRTDPNQRCWDCNIRSADLPSTWIDRKEDV
jgi:hypothetical protein